MQHSITEIGFRYSEISKLRGDKPPFEFDSFFGFAVNNMKKYSIIHNGEDLLVSTLYSDELINDYLKSIKQ